MAANAPSGVVELQTRARQIQEEARALGTTVEDTIHEAEAYLRERMRTHPLALLAAATGVGYVLGGGLPSRLTALMIALGSRLALEVGARELTARFIDRAVSERP